MPLGRDKWFNNAKGWGFIEQDGQRTDVFVHYSAIDGAGYRKLRHGDQVSFQIVDSPKGPQATQVVPRGH